MAMKNSKVTVEILLVKAELTGLPESKLLKCRNLGTVDLIWPKVGTARKSAAREMAFRKGKIDFTREEWAKRCIFREEIDGHCGVAVSISESVSVQKLRRWARLTARAILKEGADVVGSAMVGYGEIAAAPIDALATLVGEKDAPKSIAQGIVDLTTLPLAGETIQLEVPLIRPLTGKAVGKLTLEICG